MPRRHLPIAALSSLRNLKVSVLRQNGKKRNVSAYLQGEQAPARLVGIYLEHKGIWDGSYILPADRPDLVHRRPMAGVSYLSADLLPEQI